MASNDEDQQVTWTQHPHANQWSWEMQKGMLRARVYPIRHHATLYCWAVVVCDESIPIHTDVDQYVEIAAGDSLSFDGTEALAECQRDAQVALERAQPCHDCEGAFDPEAQFVNRPGKVCETCQSSGLVTELSGLPTGVCTNP